MKNNSINIFEIQKALKLAGYYDISRLSHEIKWYCKENNLPHQKIIQRILKNEPWEYIKGGAEFYGNTFFVNQHTLIPRIETEQIIDIATDFLRKNNDYSTIIDVGTGSGCIIISLAKILCKKNDFKFIATDTSIEALKVANRNCVLHKVNEKVSLRNKNLVEGVALKSGTLIIANLPYIPTDMYMNLDTSVKKYEPQQALDGGSDGLKYYKELLKQLQTKLKSNDKCTMLIEIEPSTLKNVARLFGKNITVIQDFRGLNRFCLIHLP